MSDAPSSTLCLLRHAHSSRELKGQRDHLRPLDERGWADAATMGAAIARIRPPVGHVLCSTAVRARETFEAIRNDLPAGIGETWSDELYALGVDAYYEAARTRRSDACVLMIGHNPMVEAFAASLLASGEASALARLKAGFSTACLAVMDFRHSLDAIAPGTGRLRQFLRPPGPDTEG